ncbi:hypothetical protein BDD12DRAFT_894307 [Trichophaea hybrida]|nr:hypothetical protein BDD12DRAFT_894307 [Trichophaea hybrida]
MVQLREERERIVQENAAKIKKPQDKAAAKAAPTGKGLKRSKHKEKQGAGSKMVDTNCLSVWEDEEGDITDGGGWDDETSEGEEGSVIYVRSMQCPVDALEDGNNGQEVYGQPPVVTRSGRVVKTSHLTYYMAPAGVRFPGCGRFPDKILAPNVPPIAAPIATEAGFNIAAPTIPPIAAPTVTPIPPPAQAPIPAPILVPIPAPIPAPAPAPNPAPIPAAAPAPNPAPHFQYHTVLSTVPSVRQH